MSTHAYPRPSLPPHLPASLPPSLLQVLEDFLNHRKEFRRLLLLVTWLELLRERDLWMLQDEINGLVGREGGREGEREGGREGGRGSETLRPSSSLPVAHPPSLSPSLPPAPPLPGRRLRHVALHLPARGGARPRSRPSLPYPAPPCRGRRTAGLPPPRAHLAVGPSSFILSFILSLIPSVFLLERIAR